MKKYNIHLAIRLLLLIIFSVGIGISFSLQYMWLGCFFLLADLFAIVYLTSFLKRTIIDSKRLIDSIRFCEFNVSFKGFENKGRYPELGSEMEKSIAKFNERMQEAEGLQNFYDILLNRIDSGIIVIDDNQKVEWINKTAVDMLGKPQPRSLSDMKSVSAELPNILDKLLPRETKTIKIQNGKKEYHLLVSAVLFSIKGKDQKLITLKNIQSALDENESEAWQKLTRVLTHEIMNSITPIISLAETFSSTNNDVEYDKEMITGAMNTIYRRSKGLIGFVDNYKKLTHISSPGYTSFGAKEMMNDISRLLGATGVKFISDINPPDIQFYADRGQIEQVLINLLKNAWEASAHLENPEVKIEITKNEYQKPVIEVTDNGLGIQPEILDKIFIPFFSTKRDGSGIGLSICRQIISAHGGTISVVSIPEKGSSFIIRL